MTTGWSLFPVVATSEPDGLSGNSSESDSTLVDQVVMVLSRTRRRALPRTGFAQWLHADRPQSFP